MAKTKKSVSILVEQLALLSDQADKLYTKGKKMIVFELSKNDFQDAKLQFENYDPNVKRFNVDISGVEIIFIEDELLTTSEGKS
jgi:hypothetical protein